MTPTFVGPNSAGTEAAPRLRTHIIHATLHGVVLWSLYAGASAWLVPDEVRVRDGWLSPSRSLPSHEYLEYSMRYAVLAAAVSAASLAFSLLLGTLFRFVLFIGTSTASMQDRHERWIASSVWYTMQAHAVLVRVIAVVDMLVFHISTHRIYSPWVVHLLLRVDSAVGTLGFGAWEVLLFVSLLASSFMIELLLASLVLPSIDRMVAKYIADTSTSADAGGAAGTSPSSNRSSGIFSKRRASIVGIVLVVAAALLSVTLLLDSTQDLIVPSSTHAVLVPHHVLNETDAWSMPSNATNASPTATASSYQPANTTLLPVSTNRPRFVNDRRNPALAQQLGLARLSDDDIRPPKEWLRGQLLYSDHPFPTQEHRYPRTADAVVFRKPSRTPNVVFILSDSWRDYGDYNDVLLPGMTAFVKAHVHTAKSLRSHYSGGHISQSGMFAALYSLNDYYRKYFDDAYWAARIQPSWPMLWLLDAGYQLHVVTTMPWRAWPGGIFMFHHRMQQWSSYLEFDTDAETLAAATLILEGKEAPCTGQSFRSQAYQSWLDSRNPDEPPPPIFLLVFLGGTHMPYLSPDNESFGDRELTWKNQIELKYQRSICWLDKQLFGDPEQFQTPNSTWTSGWIAPLQPAIQRDELMMFVTSDHGEGMQEHVFSHSIGCGLWDECIHVPMMALVPCGWAHMPPAAPTSHVDIWPTVVDCMLRSRIPPYSEFTSGTSWARRPGYREAVVISDMESWIEPDPKVILITSKHKFMLAVVPCPLSRTIVESDLFCFDILAITDRKDKEVTGDEVLTLLPTIERLFFTFVLQPVQWKYIHWPLPEEPQVQLVEAGSAANETHHEGLHSNNRTLHVVEVLPDVRPAIAHELGVSGRLLDFGWYLVVFELGVVACLAALGGIVAIIWLRWCQERRE